MAENKSCETAKSLQPFYSTFMSSYQLGIIAQKNSIVGIYKNVDKTMLEYIDSSCKAGMSLDDIVSNVKQECYKACDANAGLFEKSKSKVKEISHECGVVCDLNQMGSLQFMKGIQVSNHAGSESCEVQADKTITSLKRNVKDIEKNLKSPSGKDSAVIAK